VKLSKLLQCAQVYNATQSAAYNKAVTCIQKRLDYFKACADNPGLRPIADFQVGAPDY
jgi:hypothetical protein